MLSVALCAYNGEKYIVEQLDSIAAQTVVVDEVVICDDMSTDNTVHLIEEYAATAPYDIRLFRNETNLGSTRNFEKALSLCKGDTIFLSDQDDVWLPGKVETVVNYLNNEPSKTVVFTDAFIVDPALEVQDELWKYMQFDTYARGRWNDGNAFEHLVEKGNCVTGATMALKKEILPRVLPFETLNYWIHDGIIALKAALDNEIGFIDDKLMLYRRHADQQVGARDEKRLLGILSTKVRKLRWITKDAELEPTLSDLRTIQHWVTPDGRHAPFLRKRIRHLEKRKEISQMNFTSKFFPVITEWISGNYKNSSKYRNSKGWVYAVKDLLGI